MPRPHLAICLRKHCRPTVSPVFSLVSGDVFSESADSRPTYQVFLETKDTVFSFPFERETRRLETGDTCYCPASVHSQDSHSAYRELCIKYFCRFLVCFYDNDCVESRGDNETN
jgi:hypothetical protein